MKIKELIKELQELNQEDKVLLASDEEHNAIYSDVRISVYEDDKEIILFGCSGSEVE